MCPGSLYIYVDLIMIPCSPLWLLYIVSHAEYIIIRIHNFMILCVYTSYVYNNVCAVFLLIVTVPCQPKTINVLDYLHIMGNYKSSISKENNHCNTINTSINMLVI